MDNLRSGMQRVRSSHIGVFHMKVSLILCSKNGGERLETCLNHIVELDAPDDMQVILVDNGSTDGFSYSLMEKFAELCRWDCQVLQTFIPGNAAGRNVGLERADGDIFLFIDDDCYVDKRFVYEWIKVFRSSSVGFGSGRILRYTENQSDLGCVEYQYQKLLGSNYVPRGFIQGSNMAFRRECLTAAGPFDRRFGSGTAFAGEEWDLALRAGFRGWKGGYFPGPVVAHDHRRGKGETRRRLLFYDYGGGAVYAKHIFGERGALVTSRFIREFLVIGKNPLRVVSFLRGFFAFFFISAPKN